MINEEATLLKFGYKSSDLRPYSQKPVIATCETCGEDRQVKKLVGAQSKICAKCQRINQCRKNCHVNRIGRKHSEETKAKIKETHRKLGLKGERSSNFGRKFTD